MHPPSPPLTSSEAARRLGISVKTLRIYEQRGLLVPPRSAAGWRSFGPREIARARELVALRALGLRLADIKRMLAGGPADAAGILAGHRSALGAEFAALLGRIAALREMQNRLADRDMPAGIAFDLPWPWGGERFTLPDIRPLTYITGPLGSGKTRLARRLADALPDAAFLGLERRAREEPGAGPLFASLTARGATPSGALYALLAGLAEGTGPLVVDMVEQGLDAATQAVLMTHFRGRPAGARPLFLLTRSSAILDLAAVGPNEAILFCPANHSPPMIVAPCPGAEGYEAVASCVASPEVRARTEGVIAWRPPAGGSTVATSPA